MRPDVSNKSGYFLVDRRLSILRYHFVIPDLIVKPDVDVARMACIRDD